jgi:hypothetical protein
MGILRDIEQHAVAVRAELPAGVFMELDDDAPMLNLPMERPLFTLPHKTRIDVRAVTLGGDELSADNLFEQFHVDKARLQANVQRALRASDHVRVSLAEILEQRPLEQGLAELVTYEPQD